MQEMSKLLVIYKNSYTYKSEASTSKVLLRIQA